MEAERKLKKAKVDVMRANKPALRFWSPIMAVGTTSVCDKTTTAYTNGRDEVYGRAFVERLPSKQLSFVCLHEAMHKGLRHLTTWRVLFEKNPRIANIACDYVVNRMAVKADPNETVIKFPRNPDGTRMGLYDTKYDGMSAAQIFRAIEEEEQQTGRQHGQGEGQGFDEHGWDDAQGLTPEEKKELP